MLIKCSKAAVKPITVINSGGRAFPKGITSCYQDTSVTLFSTLSPFLETLYLYHASYDRYPDLLEVLESVEGVDSGSELKGNQVKRKGYLKALLITERDAAGPEIDVGDSWISEVKDCCTNDVLFLGVEYLSLYDIGSTTPGKLPVVMRSRTSDFSGKKGVAKLKIFETWHGVTGLNSVTRGDWEEVEALRNAGLVLRLFRSSDSGPCMTAAEADLLEHYVEEGLVVRDYMHDIGQFAPILL